MASTLFAEPPSATMDEALAHFVKAERLKPEGWKENRQFVAKTLVKLGRTREAVDWMERAKQLPIRNPDVRIFIGIT